MEDVGTMRLTDVEVKRLREYLLKGGFLYVDDFWGEWAWQQWTEEIGRVLDPREYPVKDIPLDHQLFRTTFVVNKGVGARRRRPALLLPVLAGRLRGRDQRRDVRVDTLTGFAACPPERCDGGFDGLKNVSPVSGITGVGCRSSMTVAPGRS